MGPLNLKRGGHVRLEGDKHEVEMKYNKFEVSFEITMRPTKWGSNTLSKNAKKE